MICNYRVFSGEHKLVERFTFRNQEGRELSDAVTAIFIDLTQAGEIAKKPVEEMTKIETWAVFFALANNPDYSDIIAEITKNMEGIRVANDTLHSISQSPEERAHFRSRRMWLQDRLHEQAVWKEEGIELGIEQGIEKTRAELEPLLVSKDKENASMKAEIVSKDAEIVSKDAEIAALRAQLDAQAKT
jgi:predicted transposase/invertase (TIGR01784 family)